MWFVPWRRCFGDCNSLAAVRAVDCDVPLIGLNAFVHQQSLTGARRHYRPVAGLTGALDLGPTIGPAHNEDREAITLADFIAISRRNADQGFEACTAGASVGFHA